MSDPASPYVCHGPLHPVTIPGVEADAGAWVCPVCGVWRHRSPPADRERRARVLAAMPGIIAAILRPGAGPVDSGECAVRLEAPFPWFGGKRRVAHEVWSRFGSVTNYVEPFFGSGAVLLGRPVVSGTETINDLDGYVANFWRSVKMSPAATAAWADAPVNENDLHARHVWLVQQRDGLRPSLEGNPDWHDPKIAGWWVWGVACWIGGGFCRGTGPWWVDAHQRLVKSAHRPVGVKRQRIHLSTRGQGVKRQRIHLSTRGQGVNRQLIHLGDRGRGVKRQLIHLGNRGRGVNRQRDLVGWFSALSARLQAVRVGSGEWSRVCGPAVTYRHGLTAVFLDPPYADTAHRDQALYRIDSAQVAHDVCRWAIRERREPTIANCALRVRRRT